jgi:hypothetical protein
MAKPIFGYQKGRFTVNNQELYNQVVLNIINQGGPSIDDESEACVYRNENGRMCAAGPFIPNDKYVPEMEEEPIFWKFRKDDEVYYEMNPRFENVFNDIDIVFLSKLQWIHDTSDHSSDYTFFMEWIPTMISFGKKNGLNLSVFSEFEDNSLVGNLITVNL